MHLSPILPVIWIPFYLAALAVRTRADRFTRMRAGRDIGAPWSGSCVETRQVDLGLTPEWALDVVARSMAAVGGSAITVDPPSWSAHGWTGHHIGAYGYQLAAYVTRVAPVTVRVTCFVRPRSGMTRLGFGAVGRLAHRLDATVRAAVTPPWTPTAAPAAGAR